MSFKVKEATGATIRREDLINNDKEFVVITDAGVSHNKHAVENTKIINAEIERLSQAGGGTIVFPEGDFSVYTILLKSNVNIFLDKESVVRAALIDKNVPGANFMEPEVNPFVALQDHGHSYLANALVYGKNVSNVMIYGPGRFDGRAYTDDGTVVYALPGGDPLEPENRNEHGHREAKWLEEEFGEGITWFGNKGIALSDCNNIVLADFSLVIGGHFAIITEGVKNLYVDGILIDTNRDAFDVDCAQDVTIVNSVFNSLTDDAIVIKASFGAGELFPSKNILVEDCIVSGYDAGSVYDGVYGRDKIVANDFCGPTGRVKLGTESTCGYEQVTIRRVKFERSRGFALEAVDCSDLKDILFEDCEMTEVSSSPIYIRAGERGRFPVKGTSASEAVYAKQPNVRMDNTGWVLPNRKEYDEYAPKRYTPSFNWNTKVSIDGHSKFDVVSQTDPAKINEANLKGKKLKADYEKYHYANANGCDHMPRVARILIRNVKVTNVDPRYPILLMGLQDSPLSDIRIENVTVTYRGGMNMLHATEQRQLYTAWEFSQYGTAMDSQLLPWGVNKFFAKNEALLPRVDWDEKIKGWVDDPYNIPEMPSCYPEPSNWGILPAFGLYARHVKGLELKNIKLYTEAPDGRHALVLDDIKGVTVKDMEYSNCKDTEAIALVSSNYRRPTGCEYVPNEPYVTTTVRDFNIISKKDERILEVTVNSPAPGTPKDTLYKYETLPIPENGYSFETKTEDMKLPLTVYRPYIVTGGWMEAKAGEIVSRKILVRDPASQAAKEQADSSIYHDMVVEKVYLTKGISRKLELKLENELVGMKLDNKGNFTWDTKGVKPGVYGVSFSVNDDIRKETAVLIIELV